MSEPVVGTCTDCIISVPNNSTLSLKYKVSVQEGINHVIKNKGEVNGYYPCSTTNVQGLTLAPGATYAPTQSATSILLSVDAPVQLTIFRDLVAFTVTVNQLFIMDDSITRFSITNTSSTVTANLFLGYTGGSST
jgi:hypothetical protein